MQYRDVLDILIPRAQRLGLTEASSGEVDAVELEMYMYNALLKLVELVDLSEYTAREPTIAVTEPGREDYPVPEDFGRLIRPTSLLTRGIRLSNGVTRSALTYLDPTDFDSDYLESGHVPTHFTVQTRTFYLRPAPDDNGGAQYTLSGLYIQRVPRITLDHEVRLDDPAALIEETLFMLASDANVLTQSLATTRTEALARLAGGDMGRATQIGDRFVPIQRA